MARPAAGDINIPCRPWPVDMNKLLFGISSPMIGRPSSDNGRRQAVCSISSAVSSADEKVNPKVIISSRAVSVMDVSNPTSSSVVPSIRSPFSLVIA